MKTARSTVAGVLVLMSTNVTQVTGAEDYSVSQWSQLTANLAIRVTALHNCQVNPKHLDFYVKCEIKNTGKKDLPVVQRARIYLVDPSGETTRCKQYDGGLHPSPVLRSGEATTWWQHGKAAGEGRYKGYVIWDGNEDARSPAVPFLITFNTVHEKELEFVRRRRLQGVADAFPVLVPNTDPNSIAYTRVTFTNDPVVVNGWLYTAFGFVVPDLVQLQVQRYTGHHRFPQRLAKEAGSQGAFVLFPSARRIGVSKCWKE